MTDYDTNEDDQYARRLREVLHTEGAAMGTNDDGLNQILNQAHGTGGSGGGRSPWLAPLAAAAAAVLLIGGLGIGIALTRSGDDSNALPVGSGSSGMPASSGTASVSPSLTASSSPPSTSTPSSTSTSSTAPAPVQVALPVYYVADMNGRGNRLYREFHTLPTPPAAKAQTALAELFGGSAVDPEYKSLWPAGTQVRTLTVDGTLARLDVTDFPDAGAEAAVLAMQQVVWTVTGADPTVKQVQIKVNGQPPNSSALAKPIGRASAFDVQADVWITAPTEGASAKSPVKVTVYGTGFEGNVPLKVFQNNRQVAAQAVTTMMGGFAEASTTFTLAAGTYVVRAYNENGKDGTLVLWDTKTFTVS